LGLKQIENFKSKNPALVGFFAFFLQLFLWCWTVQLLSRFIFLLHRNESALGSRLSVFFPATVHGFQLDLAWISYLMVFSLLIVVIASGLRLKWLPKMWFYLMLPLLFISCILSFADAEMYRVWGAKFNSQALEFMKHPTEAAASSSEAKTFTIVLCSLLIVVVLGLWLRKISKRASELADYRIVSLFALGMLLLIAPWVRGGLQTIPINQSSAYYSNNPFENAAAVNSSWNFLYYVVDQGEVIPAEALKFDLKDETAFQQYKIEGLPVPMVSGIEKPNVVVFVLESFSSHVSSFFGDGYNCTPFLDSLAQTGLSFTHAYAQGDRTAKGLAAVLSGWPGQASQTKSILTLPGKASRLPGIAKVVRKAGYNTWFFYGGDLSFDNMQAYLKSTGYQHAAGEDAFKAEQKSDKWGAHDEYVFSLAVDSISKSKPPFFATILSLSSHEPFEIPGKTNTGTETQKFLNSVKYTDACLRQFFQKAATESWYSNTIFLLVADHGRKMGLPDMETYQPKHYQVPILMWGPGLKDEYKGKKIDRIVSQTDIPQTLIQSVFKLKTTEFPFSRNMFTAQPSISFYQFWDGFGTVQDQTHVIWNNPGAKVTESEGEVAELLQVGKTVQWKAAKIFEKL
jgi:phosphoglycerol transferase MdoB-like AlkP superfamily enzyme